MPKLISLSSRVFEKSRCELYIYSAQVGICIYAALLKMQTFDIYCCCLGLNILNGHRLLALFNLFCFVLSSSSLAYFLHDDSIIEEHCLRRMMMLRHRLNFCGNYVTHGQIRLVIGLQFPPYNFLFAIS